MTEPTIRVVALLDFLKVIEGLPFEMQIRMVYSYIAHWVEYLERAA